MRLPNYTHHIAFAALPAPCLTTCSSSRSYRYNSRCLSRRLFLSIAATSYSSIILPKTSLSATCTCNMTPADIARLLNVNCQPFISLVEPINVHSLLWRGSDSADCFSEQSPAPDLLDKETYSAAGAAFFWQLEQVNRLYNGKFVPPSKAHIAVGDKRIAQQWGTAVTIWPIGNFEFSFWKTSKLIYEDGERLNDAERRGGELLTGVNLKEAILDGKEVMLDCASFYEIEQSLAEEALKAL